MRSFLLILVLIFISLQNVGAQSGTLYGIIVDKQTGEGLIGASVIIVGTGRGASTDLDGNYRITGIESGVYNVRVSYVSYQTQNVQNLQIGEEPYKLDIALAVEDITLDEIVVEAKAVTNTEASMLKVRQKSVSVSDAISAEQIQRSGSNDAADAMKKVVGASVVGGKYVFVRGLGERYSSTQLNGAELPSADPDKRSFNMDLFPTNLLDNIVTLKSFTPDKPGSFSGGLVDVGTKDFPEQFTFKFSTSATYNTNATFNEDFITGKSSGTDWLGYDDGMREVPLGLDDPNKVIPSTIAARSDAESMRLLDQYSRAFSGEMEPRTSSPFLNQGYSLSIGDQLDLFGNPFGYIASVNYGSKNNYYDGGRVARWRINGPTAQVDRLDSYLDFSDQKGTSEKSWGSLINLAYKFDPLNNVSFKVLRTQTGENTARFQEGDWDNQLNTNPITGYPIYRTRSLEYIERSLRTYQITGNHVLEFLFNSEIEWTSSFSSTTQNDPDLRYFSDDVDINEDQQLNYNISNQSYSWPTRFFRKLDESNAVLKADISVPFLQWNDITGKFKFGGYYNKTDREFKETRFEFPFDATRYTYTGDISDYMANRGVLDSTSAPFRFPVYVVKGTSNENNYTGEQTVAAFYGMIELPITYDLKFIGGARYETTTMNTENEDPSEATWATLEEEDLLPAASLVYNFTEGMNVRFAYGRTLARPNLRELSAFASFEFLGDFVYVGNPNLKRTLIDNYDLRWEWFERPGEIYAVSLFYKTMINPIERTFRVDTEQFTHQNIDDGTLYGVELELRKSLDQIHDMLTNFQANLNASFIHSEVTIPDDEYENNIKPFEPGAKKTRPLYGQSPYIINADLSYEDYDNGTSVSLVYNIFGERLSEVTLGHLPDVYEQPKQTLDFFFSQDFLENFNFKLGIKNILDAENKKTIEYKGTDYIYNSHKLGRSISFGLGYSI